MFDQILNLWYFRFMINAGYEPGSSHVDLNLGDEAILAYVQDVAEAGIALREADPVKWLVGTIAIANQKMPSEVQNEDLLVKAMLEERSLDPPVYDQVRRYLVIQGFRWISGCFG